MKLLAHHNITKMKKITPVKNVIEGAFHVLGQVILIVKVAILAGFYRFLFQNLINHVCRYVLRVRTVILLLDYVRTANPNVYHA